MRTLNTVFDRLIRPAFTFGGRSWSLFQVCGGTGVVLAMSLILTLAAFSGLSVALMAGLVVADLVTCLAVLMTAKIIRGEERFTYFHLEIGIILATAVLTWVLRQPVLAYLDISILGLGLGLMCGRVGCLMVGCCHGRPASCGVRYGPEHVAAGFSPYYPMTRFFPIQIIEAIWVGAIVLTGCVLVLNSYPPGTALSLYICAYGTGRFFFEFLRADTDRAYLWGFSESQWLSLTLMSAVVLGELLGVLPFRWWQVGTTVFVALTMLVVAIRRQVNRESNYHLLLPHHIEEIAQVLDSTSDHAANNGAGARDYARTYGVPIDCTSLGVQISAGRIKVAGNLLYHYALSNKTSHLTEASARVLARLILQIRHPAGRSDLIPGNAGVFHLLVTAA